MHSPLAPGDHFDIYHNGRLIYIYPQPDMRAVVKWVCYLDKFNADRKAAALKKAEESATSEVEKKAEEPVTEKA